MDYLAVIALCHLVVQSWDKTLSTFLQTLLVSLMHLVVYMNVFLACVHKFFLSSVYLQKYMLASLRFLNGINCWSVQIRQHSMVTLEILGLSRFFPRDLDIAGCS